MKKSDDPIVVKQILACDQNTAWKAITDLDEMVLWYFDNIPAFKAEVGFKTQFPVRSEERLFTHVWEVTEVQPNQSISYTWQYPEYPGKSIVTFSLEQADEETVITVTTDVLEDFPSETVPEFKRESCQGGWTYFMNRLAIYIDSKA